VTDVPATDLPPPDRRAKRNVAVLVAAQALLGAQMPMVFIIGGLAGQMLAPNICFATLPISLIVFGSMTTAPWLSQVMQSHGRRTGFLIGVTAGCLGAAVGAAALTLGSFILFLLGSYLTGIFMSSYGFYRFAATDTASEGFKPKAISYVMAGGLVAAILGPQLVKLTVDSFVVPFLGTYLAVIAVNMIGFALFPMLDIPKPPRSQPGEATGRTRRQMLRDPLILVAMICAMVAYALMNLVMTSTPLAVVGCGFSKNAAADVVSAHVLAMYIPSFFTGHLIVRYGTTRIVALGMLILAGAGLVALSGVELGNFFLALILLGIGWNFAFIGATTMLSLAHSPQERGRLQGLNDALVMGCVTIASLASGGLMNCSGGDAVTGWTAVNIAMLPLLTLAGGALIWLVLRPQPAHGQGSAPGR
jgi:MFS family permease